MRAFLFISIFSYPSIASNDSGRFLERRDGTHSDIRLHAGLDFTSQYTSQGKRADKVRSALQHLWSGYRNATWGDDEVRPISGEKGEEWGGVGMFILDTLDTLWLADLKKEFAQGEQWVSKLQLEPLDRSMRSSFFEMTIRGLSGLLSAYALSGHRVFLDKAKLLGDHLLKGFPRGSDKHAWPVAYIDVHNPRDKEVTPSFHSSTSLLADVGSNVLEFSYLSEATGDRRYKRTAEKMFNKLIDLSNSTDQALAPTELDPYSTRFVGQSVSLGSRGDSYFEYLLKRYLQDGCKDQHLLLAWKKAMSEMKKYLLKESPQGLTYLASPAERRKAGKIDASAEMDHLSCFVGGMLAIASQYVPEKEVEDWWLPTGEKITQTCYAMYQSTPSGLAPETVIFNRDGMHANLKEFRLRPETLESLFYLHRITGNSTYSDWSFDIFKAIDKNTKTKYGFASVIDVMHEPVRLKDSEETFMGAETLKYALLTQLPPGSLSLDQFVLNTEAHPFPAAKSSCAKH